MHIYKGGIVGLDKTQGGLGIKDTKYFNWALLRKISWTLNNPISIITKIYKAKYCRGEDNLLYATYKSSDAWVRRVSTNRCFEK